MTPPLQSNDAASGAAEGRPPSLIWIVVALCIGLPSLALHRVVSSFSLRGDAAALRDAVHPGGGLELRLGTLALGGLRAGLGCLGADPDAQALLGPLSGLECGIYPNAEQRSPGVGDVLSAGDSVMQARGWNRIVGVTGPGAVVGVYVRELAAEAEHLRLCVLVRQQEHTVIAGAVCQVAGLQHLLGEERWRIAGGRALSGGRPPMF
ncbi:MAG: hypothetical protein JNL10_10210 [Verrucomicrobiales bacterium]|nr:hypothetical protein [Verrucomicrobiales bacterium]